MSSEKQAEAQAIPLRSKQDEAFGQQAGPPVYTQQAPPPGPPVYTQQPGVVYVTGQAPPPPPGGVPPDDYFIMSIFTIFCCFWPIGIVALLKSLEVRKAVTRGDYAAAGVASRSALQFNKLAIIVGVVSSVVALIIVVLAQLQWIIPLATRASRN